MQWKFPSRNYGETEGYANPGLEWFKDDPLKALAREICQNSLDAYYDESEPVRIELQLDFVPVSEFPGLVDLEDALRKCRDFQYNKNDDRAQAFIKNALRELRNEKIPVLRISDYNTIGLQGAFDTENATPWISLVKSTAISIKPDSKGAAGSYGIGKAAVFINSDLQTAFYRTKDKEGVEAAQGVAHLMAFYDNSIEDEDPVRRSAGYYGNEENNSPVERIEELDRLNKRTKVGTDIFIPGFKFARSGKSNWTDIIVGEILENFLMSIYYGRLEVAIGNTVISKEKLSSVIARYKNQAKNAFCYNKILNSKDDTVEEKKQFHNLGELCLRLNYNHEMNKKILVVRKTGMKIADIPSLPKGITFSGILELKDEKLNEFFREMENPQHNKWEPARHSNPELARQYKNEVEEWVRGVITKKLEERSGAESDINVGDLFTAVDKDDKGFKEEDKKKEGILDASKSVDVSVSKQHRGTIKGTGGAGSYKAKGRITDNGEATGHRHRTGTKGGKPTGRTGFTEKGGEDTVYSGLVAVDTIARVITQSDGTYRLILTSEYDASDVKVEIVTIGENGRELSLRIQNVVSGNASNKNGTLYLPYIKAGQKAVVVFTIAGKQKYAMGVRVYGN